MKLSFAPFDDALIERVFQPVSDVLSDRLGLDRLRVACFCTDAAAIGWILSQAHVLSDAVLGWDATNAFVRLSLLLVGLAALTSLRTLFRRVATRGKGNPLRLAMRPHRGVVLAMLIARVVDLGGLTMPGIADLGMLAAAAIALYLAACAARPPLRRPLAALEPAG